MPIFIAEQASNTFRHTMKRCAWFILLFALFASGTNAAEVRLEGDRLWLRARHAPLHEVMRGFAHAGVRVRMDPELRATINVTIEDADAGQALAKLFDSIGYVLIWEVMDGPLGEWPKLAEIMMFRPGNPEDARPLFADEERLRIMTMPDGSGIEYVADEIVIGFAPGSDRNAIRELIRQIGGTVVESVPELGIYRIRLPPGANVPALVSQLARNPLVAEVEPNYVYRLPETVALPGGDTTPAGPVRQPRAGAPPIAVLDSGLTMLPNMEGLIVGGFNALHPDRPYEDTAGHGTQMALIGTGAVRPDGWENDSGVPVLAIRAFNDDGVTSNFAQMRSLFHAAEQGATVLNMSWGSPVNSTFLELAISKATQANILVVASAGNEPLNQPLYPAAYPDVIAVGAAQKDGAPWPQSNYGDFIFLSAPGTATLPVGYQGAPGAYAGTSIAAAAVSHALGLYFEQFPNATPAQARTALKQAVTRDGQEWDPQLGHGVLDQNALRRLLAD